MTETEKHNELVNTMEFLEAVNSLINETVAIQNLPFAELTPDIWASIQQNAGFSRNILEVIKAMLIQSAKIIDNDALHAHLQTVLLAP